MNTKKLNAVVEVVMQSGMTVDELELLTQEISKLKKVKTESKQRLKKTILLARTDFHPVCYTGSLSSH
jgi:hypothetical protein